VLIIRVLLCCGNGFLSQKSLFISKIYQKTGKNANIVKVLTVKYVCSCTVQSVCGGGVEIIMSGKVKKKEEPGKN
jgi:hypothetical protein